MPCREIDLGDGGVAIACTRGSHAPQCQTPGCTYPGAFQCDYPVTRDGKAGTCDRHCCASHRVHVGVNRDYCGSHARLKR
jgi:hypothetical protein